MLVYLLAINCISSLLFILDKILAQQKKQRIPESLLHFLEAAGGVFSIVPLMYLIRHKNRKWKYYLITFLILAIWIFSYTALH